MFARSCLGLLLLLSTYGFCQVDVGTTEEATSTPSAEAAMSAPPPVSGADYSTTFASEIQSNILRAGLTLSTAYSNNVQGGETPTSDISYSLWPTIAFDATSTRLHWVLSYSPGFTFYQHMSSLNQSNQNLALDFQYHLSPHVTASFRDSFQKTSDPFNQPNPLAAGPVSGSVPSSNVAVIAPVADQIHNAANAQLNYQFREDGMVGIGGTFNNLFYPNPAEVPGLFNSSSTGASAFYSYRLREKYDLGVSYQYQYALATQPGGLGSTQTQTQTQTVFFFTTVHLTPTLSFSLSGGPQHYDATQAPLPASRSWSPLMMASFSWRGERTSLAASYSRVVTGGGGLAGAYHSNLASISGAWQLNRNWALGLSAGYSLYETLTPLFLGPDSGGHTVSGTVSVQRPLGEHFNMQAGYTWIQQSYAGIEAISAVPDTNREFISISYQFVRPLKK
jgi:hypothetical protein